MLWFRYYLTAPPTQNRKTKRQIVENKLMSNIEEKNLSNERLPVTVPVSPGTCYLQESFGRWVHWLTNRN